MFEDYKINAKRNYEELQENLYCKVDALRTCEYPIISLNDSIAYKAIFQFYVEDYIESLKSLCTLHKLLMEYTPEKKMSINKGIELRRYCVVNIDECKYNMILCKIMLKEYDEAIKDLNELMEVVEEELVHWLVLLRDCISILF